MPATPNVRELWSAWRTISGWELGMLPGEGGMSAEGEKQQKRVESIRMKLWHNLLQIYRKECKNCLTNKTYSILFFGLLFNNLGGPIYHDELLSVKCNDNALVLIY